MVRMSMHFYSWVNDRKSNKFQEIVDRILGIRDKTNSSTSIDTTLVSNIPLVRQKGDAKGG